MSKISRKYTEEFKAMRKEITKIKEENEILKKLWPYYQRTKLNN